MRPAVIWTVASRNVASKKLRSTLTVAGAAIGVGAIVFLVSLGLGLQRLVTQQIVGSASVKTIDVKSAKSRALVLDAKAAATFAGLPGVEAVSSVLALASSVRSEGASTDAVLYGIDAGYAATSPFTIVAGVQPSVEDPGSVLVNVSYVKAAGIEKPEAAVGRTMEATIGSPSSGGEQAVRSYVIRGVADTGSGSELYAARAPLEAAGFTRYDDVKVVASTQEGLPGLRRQIEAAGFTTTSAADTVAQVDRLFKFFNFILAGFGGIGMLIAVLGMLNTLTISLLERTQEIGLLISLGASRSDVRKLFIVEAVLLSVGGGAAGAAGAWLFGSGVNLLLTRLAADRGVGQTVNLFSVPWWLALGTLLFSVLIGYAVVFVPARRTSRISPVDALRHE